MLLSAVKPGSAFLWILLFVTAVMSGCSSSSQRVIELKRFPMDSLDGIITRSGAELDTDNSSDGKGSLRVIAKGPETIRLFEVNDLDAEDGRLIYQAKLRAKGLAGQTYLELRCHFPDGEEVLSTDAQVILTGTTGWVTSQTSCFVKKGERPDVIKLNLVINGRGTVWIDDVRLMKGPFQEKKSQLPQGNV